MILEDFAMLGKTVPEPNSDGRVFVCSAGVSPECKRLVRIYPLSRWQAPRRWSINRVPVERNPRDNRFESFCLKGNRKPEAHAQINSLFTEVGYVAREQRSDLLNKYIVASIHEANEKRLSLAIIEPRDVAQLHFKEWPGEPEPPPLSLFAEHDEERQRLGARRFKYQPRLKFQDAAGGHDLQLRDWGVYEFMRKQGDERRHQLADAAHLSGKPLFLVGNMNHHRNAWLVISVLLPLRPQMTLDLESAA